MKQAWSVSPRNILTGLICLAAGALAALAFPPWNFWPGFLGWALLLWRVDAASDARRPLWTAFGAGWLAGFSYFLIGCWWVAEAFLVDKRQAWMGPIAACLLPAGLALFWGAACALYRRFAPRHLGRVPVFAAMFSAAEWLRGHVLTGFPWNLPGEGWVAGSPPSQAAALVGAYGLSFLTLLAFCAFAPLLRPGSRKRRIGVAVGGVLILAALWVGGALRLMQAELKPTRTVVRIVQADVNQESKWSPEEFRHILRRYTNLTASQGDATPNVVIWPEGALPAGAEDILNPENFIAPAIAQSLGSGQTLLMGTYRSERVRGRTLYYNSLIALIRDGDGLRQVAAYDKYRLVPFGEYMPLDSLMGALGIKDLTHVGDGFSAGPRPQPLALPGLPRMQPLICYESLYPGLAQDGPGRPAWIANISNDAWFGAKTSGPIQHLNLASYRAIEQGLPIVRATPTGVSAAIDPWGRVMPGARKNSGESGVIDVRLPAPATVTLYSRLGDLLFGVMIILGLVFMIRQPVSREYNTPPDENALEGAGVGPDQEPES